METVSKKYADSLFAIAKEENKVALYRKEAGEIYVSLKESPELIHLLSSYFLLEKEKDQAIDEIYSNISLPELKSFIKVICLHGRAYLIMRIFREFKALTDLELHIASGVIYSAQKLTAEQVKSIEQAVSEKENLQAELINEVDPSLIGGVKVVVRDKVIDYSLLSALNGLKDKLIHGGK